MTEQGGGMEQQRGRFFLGIGAVVLPVVFVGYVMRLPEPDTIKIEQVMALAFVATLLLAASAFCWGAGLSSWKSSDD
jgi:hypothetical protein